MSEEKKQEKNYYGQVPNIIHDSDLSIYARALYGYLVKFYGEGKKKYIFEQNLSTIAIMTDMSRDKVIEAKKELLQWIVPLIQIVEIKDHEKGGVRHQIFLTDEIWDLQKKHYQALTIKQSNARTGTNLPYCKDDILEFEKTKKLALAKDKSKASRDDFENRRKKGQSTNRLPTDEITVQKLQNNGSGSRNIDCSKEHNTKNINTERKSSFSDSSSLARFNEEQKILLMFFLELNGLTEKDLPAPDSSDIHKWKSTIKTMLKKVNNDEKLGQKILQRVFNRKGYVSKIMFVLEDFNKEYPTYLKELEDDKKIAEEVKKQKAEKYITDDPEKAKQYVKDLRQQFRQMN